jgi:hypothetical protein
MVLDAITQAPIAEDGDHVWVFDALGELVWEVPELPAVNGAPEVRVEWSGASLQPGMIDQFRVASYRGDVAGQVLLSRSEDLRGVFQYATASSQ